MSVRVIVLLQHLDSRKVLQESRVREAQLPGEILARQNTRTNKLASGIDSFFPSYVVQGSVRYDASRVL